MSYCVNCGVELDASLQACPLCHTPVYHPQAIPASEVKSPFPTQRGQVDVIKRKDLGILCSIVVLSTSLTCILLNKLVFNTSPWSLIVVGICVLLWVVLIPFVIYSRLPVYVSLAFDGLACATYLFMLTYLTASRDWFWFIGLPIVTLTTILIELFTLCIRRLPVSFLTVSLYLFIFIPLECVGIDATISFAIRKGVSLTWSMIVLTVCVIIDILLITVLSRSRLRNAVRRRLHF